MFLQGLTSLAVVYVRVIKVRTCPGCPKTILAKNFPDDPYFFLFYLVDKRNIIIVKYFYI